jgi:hypothetical protein
VETVIPSIIKKEWDQQRLIKHNIEFKLFFETLLREEKISTYKILKERVTFETHTFGYEAVIAGTEEYKVEFLFCIHLHIHHGEIVIDRNNSRQYHISLPLYFKADIVDAFVRARLNSWKKGERNEFFFYNYFLKPLTKDLLKNLTIIGVQRATNEADKDHGFDFIVLFTVKDSKEIQQVKFNLKSSSHFLARHKKYYPDISTFSFNQEDLSDKRKLKMKFLHFISLAQHAPMHF